MNGLDTNPISWSCKTPIGTMDHLIQILSTHLSDDGCHDRPKTSPISQVSPRKTSFEACVAWWVGSVLVVGVRHLSQVRLLDDP